MPGIGLSPDLRLDRATRHHRWEGDDMVGRLKPLRYLIKIVVNVFLGWKR